MISTNRVKPDIVFVYLGNPVPEYVLENFFKTAESFANQTHLFVDKESSKGVVLKGIETGNIHEIAKPQFEKKFKLNHDPEFRQNFWSLTLERILVLNQIHEKLGKKAPILHLEGDMLLLPSFPFSRVCKSKLKWFKHGLNEDVGSILYSPNLLETEWLCEAILREIQNDSSLTDMSVLNRIRLQNINRIDTFPTIFEMNKNEKNQDLFDGSFLGQWIFGMDPRNTYGMEILRENSNFKFADESNTLGNLMKTVEIRLDSECGLHGEANGSTFRLHSLHIHSKNPDIFSREFLGRYFSYQEIDNRQSPVIVGFNLKVLFQLILQNFKNRSMLSYLRHLLGFLFKRYPSDSYSRINSLRRFVLRKMAKR